MHRHADELAVNDIANGVNDILYEIATSRRGDYVQVLGRWVKVKEGWLHFLIGGAILLKRTLSEKVIPKSHLNKVRDLSRFFLNGQRRVPKDLWLWYLDFKKEWDGLYPAVLSWDDKVEDGVELIKLLNFSVHNTIKEDEEKLKGILGAIRKTDAWIRACPVININKTLYGDILIVPSLKGKFAAWYYESDDTVSIRTDKRVQKYELSRTLVHELGHRYWKKFAETGRIEEWTEHHKRTESGDVVVRLPEVGDRIEIGWDALVTVVDDSGGKYRIQGLKGGQMMEGIINQDKLRDVYESRVQAAKFPTPYSMKDEEEHFCDALSLFADGSLNEPHVEVFEKIWT